MHECIKCREVLDDLIYAEDRKPACPNCETPTHITTFRALYAKEVDVARPEELSVDDESSCYNHPDKAAVISCESCGRYVCSLCQIELKGQQLCPACIHAGQSKSKIKDLENRRVLYGNIALGLSTIPMLMFYLTIFTAPAAIFTAIKYWKKPGPMFSRVRWRESLAILFSLLQIAGWIALFIGLYAEFFVQSVGNETFFDEH